MTEQQGPPFTIAELGQKFGAQLAQAYAEIITLEKHVASQALTIQAMTQNEARLLDHIEDLKAEIDGLKAKRAAPPSERLFNVD